MSGKKKRMREAAVEDVGSGQDGENTRNCDNLLDLVQLIQEQKALVTAPETRRKMDKVVQSEKAVATVNATDADVQCAKPSPQKKKRRKNKSKKKVTVESGNTSTATTNSGSQKPVQKNAVHPGSADQANGYHIQAGLKTESQKPTLQPKKKRNRRRSNLGKDKANQELNTSQSSNISNGQVEEEDNVQTISDHSVDDTLLATSEIIDLTEDSILEDPSSFEPYSNDEVSRAQDSMEMEVNQGPLKWFLQRLKIRNTATNFVPRTSRMENEYAGLDDDFPMPLSS